MGAKCECCKYQTHSPNDYRIYQQFNFELCEFKAIIDIDIELLKSLKIINTNSPEITYNGPKAIRDSGELLSEITSRIPAEGKVLDLGCGPRDQAEPVDYLGYNYVGIDYFNYSADLLADAHAIPFKSNSFDCVLSYAVLEHMYNSFLAIREVERVLKSGVIYVGTVSQSEPFHNSFFHLTPWGYYH